MKLRLTQIYESDGETTFNSYETYGFRFVEGQTVNFSRSDLKLSADCELYGGTCAQATVTKVVNASTFKLSFKPLVFNGKFQRTCEDAIVYRNVSLGSSALLCQYTAFDIVSIDRVWTDAPNVWNPFVNITDSMVFMSDEDPRARRSSDQSSCWEVPKTNTCPSIPGSCVLDPTCTCGPGMKKTTILGGDNFSMDYLGVNYDAGVWCWRCDKEVQRQCAEQAYHASADLSTCTRQSCNCPESTKWNNPWIKMTWYADANYSKFVKKGSIDAHRCYTCGNSPAVYVSKKINVTREIEVVLMGNNLASITV